MGPRERERLMTRLKELKRLQNALYDELDALLSAAPYGARTYSALQTVLAGKPGTERRSIRAEWHKWERKVKDLRRKIAGVADRVVKLRYKLDLDPFGGDDPS